MACPEKDKENKEYLINWIIHMLWVLIMRSVCMFSIAYLENPRRWAISRAVKLLFPLRQWKTMSSSSFLGAFTPNCFWNCCGGSFSDSSSCPTERYIKTESERAYWNKKRWFFTSVDLQGMLTESGIRPAWNSSGFLTSKSCTLWLASIALSCSYVTTDTENVKNQSKRVDTELIF